MLTHTDVQGSDWARCGFLKGKKAMSGNSQAEDVTTEAQERAVHRAIAPNRVWLCDLSASLMCGLACWVAGETVRGWFVGPNLLRLMSDEERLGPWPHGISPRRRTWHWRWVYLAGFSVWPRTRRGHCPQIGQGGDDPRNHWLYCRDGRWSRCGVCRDARFLSGIQSKSAFNRSCGSDAGARSPLGTPGLGRGLGLRPWTW